MHQRVYWKLESERETCARQLQIDAPVVTAGELRVMIARQLKLVGASSWTSEQQRRAAEQEQQEEEAAWDAMEAGGQEYLFSFRDSAWRRQQKRKRSLQTRRRECARPCDALVLYLMQQSATACNDDGASHHRRRALLDDDNTQVPCSSVLVVRRLPPHCGHGRPPLPPLLGVNHHRLQDDNDDDNDEDNKNTREDEDNGYYGYGYYDYGNGYYGNGYYDYGYGYGVYSYATDTARTSKMTRATGASTSMDAHAYAPGV